MERIKLFVELLNAHLVITVWQQKSDIIHQPTTAAARTEFQHQAQVLLKAKGTKLSYVLLLMRYWSTAPRI